MRIAVIFLLLMLSGAASGQEDPNPESEQSDCAARMKVVLTPPEKVSFPGPGGRTLYGWLHKPAGKGPFPAVIWNHGSGLMSDTTRTFQRKDLASLYAGNGYVFFTPHRTGHGLSKEAGQSTVQKDRENCVGADREEIRTCKIRYHEEASLDAAAAVSWLKAQPYVRRDRIAVTGSSYGGIQTILTAEKDLGLRAFIPFTPAAMSWANVLLRQRLLSALEKAHAPVFLIQAEGDYNTGPYEVLGTYLNGKGSWNKGKLYPKFGTTPEEAHAEFSTTCRGVEVWGKDVLAFLKATMR